MGSKGDQLHVDRLSTEVQRRLSRKRWLWRKLGQYFYMLIFLPRPKDSWVFDGSALGLVEEAVKFAAGRIEGALLLFRAVVDQWAAVGSNHITKKLLGSDLPQSRVVVQVADDFSTQQPEIVHVPANVFGERLDAARCSMKSRKQTTSVVSAK